MADPSDVPRPEAKYRVRGRSLMIGDQVYDRGEILTESDLGKQASILLSNRLIARVHEVDVVTIPADHSLWARLKEFLRYKRSRD